MWTQCLGVFLAVVSTVRGNVVHERRSPVVGEADLYERSAADSDAIVGVNIALTQRNLEHSYDFVMDVADPSSSNYAKHWSSEQIANTFAPSQATVDKVQAWLSEAGIDHAQQSENRGWMTLEVPLAQLEKLVNAKYYEFKDSDGGIRLGCDEYYIPQHLLGHIDYITPGIHLSKVVKTKRAIPSPSKAKSSTEKFPDEIQVRDVTIASADLGKCGKSITPACLRALYNIPLPVKMPNVSSTALGIFQDGYNYAQKDLNLFFSKFAPYISQGTCPTTVVIDNGTKGDIKGEEANVDFQIAYGQLGQVEITNYQTRHPTKFKGGDDLIDPLLAAIDASYCTQAMRDAGFQCGGDNLTTVVSVSYGLSEVLTLSASIQRRACNEIMKYTLQGHTFVVSSGDFGVSNFPTGPPCNSNGCLSSGLNSLNDGSIFVPQFPTVCPYVLSVGATQLYANQTIGEPESVMETAGGFSCTDDAIISSGGGFSNYFPRPAYQNATVNQYLASHAPKYKYYISNGVDISSNKTTVGANGGIYNRAGRAYPDVSANGVNYTYYDGGSLQTTLGTSLSTPLWASIITLLNTERAGLGKSPVGFINPVLYKNPQVFTDITRGSNPGCDTKGFPAVTGWDPSTGLGTPKYPELLALFKSLP